jgi:hypothetical protein
MHDLPDWLRRAIRTAIQVFLATLLTSLTAATLTDVSGMEWWHKALASAALSALIALISAIVSGLQNMAEDNGYMRALLKAPASPGVHPEPDPGPGQRLERHQDS